MGRIRQVLGLEPRRSDDALSFDEWVSYFNYLGNLYPFATSGSLKQDREEVAATFGGFADGAVKGDGVVFACMAVRQLFFSEARFQYRQMENGRPGQLFGDKSLELLERPWPNGTTGDLLSRAIQDADLSGNFFAVRRPGRITRMRPDWVTIVLGSPSGHPLDVEVAGYQFHPGGPASGSDPVNLLPENVCHFAPMPDPMASFRGMSWLTPVIREVMADKAATLHKLMFFENGGTPNLVVSLDAAIKGEAFTKWVQAFREQHEGVTNAYRTLYLGGGSDVTVVGRDMQQMEFKVTQGAGETRIAAAAGVPPVIVGLSEGLAAATYSNYQLAMRRFSDLTMRPLWRNISGSLETLLDVPGRAHLWYDDRDIPALAQNEKDDADIQAVRAQAIRQLIDAGYVSDSVVEAVTTSDMTKLTHSGLFSVQLQPAGTKPQQSPNGQVDEPVPQP